MLEEYGWPVLSESGIVLMIEIGDQSEEFVKIISNGSHSAIPGFSEYSSRDIRNRPLTIL